MSVLITSPLVVYKKFPLSQPHQHFSFLFFLLTAVLAGTKCYLTIVFIWISLTLNGDWFFFSPFTSLLYIWFCCCCWSVSQFFVGLFVMGCCWDIWVPCILYTITPCWCPVTLATAVLCWNFLFGIIPRVYVSLASHAFELFAQTGVVMYYPMFSSVVSHFEVIVIFF